jgi:5-methyltetrahydropteroyltriglutamate--homocysteine methyltransferase
MTVFYRADVIGSLLRPPYLKEARQSWEAGELSTPEFKRLEDRAVNEAIALQERAGLEIVTDGEMRRSHFVGPLWDVVDGFSSLPAPVVQWHEKTPEEVFERRIPACVTGKLRRRRSLAAEEFSSARGQTDKLVKITLPSPLMLSLWWSPEHSTAAYKDAFALFTDAAEILRQEVHELANLGCEYVQIDAPELATLVDESHRRNTFAARGIAPERLLTEGIDLLNTVADTPGVTFGLHLCRGNNQGRWMAHGGYEAISQQIFQRAARYDIFLLEYDDWRSGSFEPLADVPGDKKVVLGLVSTKKNELEPADGLVMRIDEASRHFPREQLALSTQCGFASVMQGNPIDEAIQEPKLRLVVDVARRVWA